jgi:hypothetical protein
MQTSFLTLNSALQSKTRQTLLSSHTRTHGYSQKVFATLGSFTDQRRKTRGPKGCFGIHRWSKIARVDVGIQKRRHQGWNFGKLYWRILEWILVGTQSIRGVEFESEDGPDPKTVQDPIQWAASLCFAAVKLASSIREETFVPDTFKENPLCMDQYKAVFGVAWVPHLSGDNIDVYPHSSHIFKPCMWPDRCVLVVDEEDIVEILQKIDKNSKWQANPAKMARKSLSLLTSLGQRQWAKLRAGILGIGNNE